MTEDTATGSVLQTRRLGQGRLELSVLGFGGLQIGDYFVRLPEDVAIGAVAAAWQRRIRYFDTAPLYGRGLSEHRLGSVLRQHPRSAFVLSTKVGRLLEPDDDIADDPQRRGLPFRLRLDLSYDAAWRSVEQSLHRLGLSRIDIAYIHDLEPRVHGVDYPARFAEAMAGCYRALDDMRRQGIVAAIGAGLNENDAAEQLIREADIDCLMLAGRYTLLEQQTLDGAMAAAVSRGVGIVIGAPFNSGVLATGATADARYGNRPLTPEMATRVRAIEAICARHRVPLAAAALQFPLAHPAVVSVVAGMASAEEVRRNVDLITMQIPAGLWADLLDQRLIRPDAPVPAPT